MTTTEKRASPPKHRHDGTSPLPLGMDWSPPPKKWDGRNTVWPHDPHTGWSYCVMIPSWSVQTGSGASSDSLLNPIVFYRIQVGIQSPEGVSSIHGLLHRFSDFLKLFSAAQLLSRDDEHVVVADVRKIKGSDYSEDLTTVDGEDPTEADDEMRKMLTDTLVDNARLRKQVNSVIRRALKTLMEPEKQDGSDEAPTRKTVLNRFFER